MRWNLVCAKVHYKSGIYETLAYAEESYGVGDAARIMVLSGYETDCKIVEIRKRNVKPNNSHAKVIEMKASTNMETEKEEQLIMLGAKVVEVKHINSDRRLTCYTDLNLKEGDVVVYDSGDKTYLHVGTIVNIDPEEIATVTWIVDRVDLSRHHDRLEKEKAARKLLARLNAKKKQFQDIELLRLIAASDAETKEMLDQYLYLTGGGKVDG